MDTDYGDWPVTQETRKIVLNTLYEAEQALSGCHEVCFQPADKARESEQYAALKSVRHTIVILGGDYNKPE